jgi:hypothetical protein
MCMVVGDRSAICTTFGLTFNLIFFSQPKHRRVIACVLNLMHLVLAITNSGFCHINND